MRFIKYMKTGNKTNTTTITVIITFTHTFV